MKSFAKFTVVIPLYNHEKYIEEALLSVINQNYQIDEIIIIDDGSKDGSYQKIHNILSKHHQINLIRQENCGTAKTLNRAIDMSCSEWIAVLNSDDSFLPTKISRCAEIAKEMPNVDLIAGGINFIDEQSNMIKTGISREWMERSLDFLKRSKSFPISIINENFIATTSNMVFKKELWRDVQGFRNFRYCNDLDFLLRSHKNNNYFYDLDYVHINYRLHANNTIAEDVSRVRLERAFVSMENLSKLVAAETDISYVIEAVQNLKLAEPMFILDIINNIYNDDFTWEKVENLLKNDQFKRSLTF